MPDRTNGIVRTSPIATDLQLTIEQEMADKEKPIQSVPKKNRAVEEDGELVKKQYAEVHVTSFGNHA